MNNYLICSDKSWNAKLADDLNIIFKKEAEFSLLTDRQDFDYYATRLKPKKIFYPHWNYIIPKEIYENYECVIFHTGDHRGGSPIQHLIIRGDHIATVRAMKAEKEVDSGNIYLEKVVALSGNIEEIFMRINEKIKQIIIDIIKHDLKPEIPNTLHTVLKRRKPHESDIKMLENLDKVYDYIRMLDSDNYPRAYLETDKLRFEFSNATRKVGKVEAIVKIMEK